MQPDANEYSVSRRAPDVEDYIDIARRHKAWILGPTFLGLVVAVVVAFVWPDTYVSEAVIRIVPPVVPERYIPANINMAMDQRINSMAQVILSKTSLTNIIQTYNLYPEKRNKLPMEDIVEEMKAAIRVGQVFNIQRGQTMTAFAAAFSYSNRYLAQKVTADLASRFIDENIRARSSQSVLTTSFLKDQFAQAKKDLDTAQQKLSQFQAANRDRLPDQFEQSVQRLSALESQSSATIGSINRATQEKMLLESKMEGLRRQATSTVQTVPTPEQTMVQQETNQRLVQARQRPSEPGERTHAVA